MKDKKLLKLVAFVLSSTYRKKVMEVLHEYNITTPSKISKACQFPSNQSSNILRILSEKGLVECLNPEVHKGRLYYLTGLGEEVYQHLDDIKV